MSLALTDLSMEVAPSQMMGFPFMDWGGAEGAAGGAVDAVDVTGAVDAAAALPTGATEGLASDVGV